MRTTFLALALPLFLLGAKREPPTPVPPPEPASVTETTTDLLKTMEMSGSVTLEDPGAEPRATIVLAPRPGASATLEVTQRMTMTMAMNGQSMPVPATNTVTTSRIAVGPADAEGNVRIRNEIQNLQTTGGGDAGAAANAAAEAFRGVTTSIVVSPAGRILGVEAETTGDPAMAEMVRQISKQALQNMPMFPVEAVGIGARWRTEYEVSIAGFTLLAEMTSTLREVAPESVVIDIATTMQQGNSLMQLPGLPPDAKIEITRLVAEGTGTMRVDLENLATLLDQKMKMDMGMTISMGSESMPPMAMSMQMEQEMSTKKLD